MNNNEKVTHANVESNDSGFDSSAQRLSFEEHMKEMNWADVRKLGYEEQKKHIMDEMNRRIQNGEKVEDIQRSFYERDQQLIDKNDPMLDNLTGAPSAEKYAGAAPEIVQNSASENAEKVQTSSEE